MINLALSIAAAVVAFLAFRLSGEQDVGRDEAHERR